MIALSEHFNFKKLFRFAIPSIIMLIFTSIYGVIDGFFVSNFVGKDAFSAVNFVYPVLIILGCFGFMFGTGSAALISKTMGEGDNKKANEIFSMIVFVAVIVGLILSISAIILLPKILFALGAKDTLLKNATLYGRIILAVLPFYILQYEFQCLFAVSEKPKLGLYVALIAGFSNIIGDAIASFCLPTNLKFIGAGVASALGFFLGGLIPIIYFIRKNTSRLRLGKFKMNFKYLGQIVLNGSSEFVSNVSGSVVSMLYNIKLMEYAPENGIAAYGVLMYVNMIFQAIFIGYSVGISPIIGYNFGAKNDSELQNIFKKSLITISITAICMFLCGELLARPMGLIFVSYDEELLALTIRAFRFFSFSFLFSGFTIFTSSFFTSLNNGKISMGVSFFRTCVCQISCVLILPLIFKIDGIWLSMTAADIAACTLSIIFLIIKRKKYNY